MMSPPGGIIDTAICKNIQHSLTCCEDGGHFRHLRTLYEAGELTGAINRIIEDMNHAFLVSVLTRDFLSHDLGLAAWNLRKERDPEKRTTILDEIDAGAVTHGFRGFFMPRCNLQLNCPASHQRWSVNNLPSK